MAGGMELGTVSRGFRSMFFMLTPNESSFQKVEAVPQYVEQATPFFIGLMVLELLVGVLKTGGSVVTISDGLTSISAGMVSRLPICVCSCRKSVTLLLCHYRKVAVLWAAHQVHHSSEYYNLTTALRQSLTQQFTSWIFYMPLALALPPSIFAVHIQLNLLYQFWIHTELIRDLGPLELIFNTPKHHRVHHGRNLYCIDKNYGGILIIWDRIFGTFASETDKVIYGLVFPIRRFEILHVQFHYYLYLWKKSKIYKTIIHKLATFFNGPSWKPGKSRLGDHDDNPKVTGKEVPHDPSWSMPLQVYVVIHFLLVLGTYHELIENKMMLSQLTVLGMTCYILLTLTSLGFIIDQRPRAASLEMLRCVIMVTMHRYSYIKPFLPLLAVPTETCFDCQIWLDNMENQKQKTHKTSFKHSAACRHF
uniref:Alkylglycerol monooxygenase n=1 Tax=Amphiprion ocellaris TaxID=80972 RepID=A0AAQ5ZCM9_AMPOC